MANMLHSAIAKITALILVGVVVWAANAGRWPERVAALTIGVDWAGTVLFQDHHAHHHLQPVWFILDALQAAALLILVVTCRRTWVLWAAAFAIMLVLTHVTVLLDVDISQWSYLTASYIWGLGVFAALGVGVALEGRTPAGSPILPMARMGWR